MIQCPSCAYKYRSDLSLCPACGFSPPIISGVASWAPNLATETRGFKGEYFSDLAGLEENHFWFESRNSLILWVLRKYCSQLTSFMEIGCGTGYVLREVTKFFPVARVVGTEVLTDGLVIAGARVETAKLLQMDARSIPYRDEFDAIGVFDVLEHIVEDETVLGEIYGALRSNGVLIITVPQHPSLWSAADTYACHVRRYTSAEIIEKAKQAGFRIVRSTSFVSLLLPLMLLSRLSRRTDFDPRAEFRLPRFINNALKIIMRVERMIIRVGVDFPLGGSRLVVAMKD